MLPIALAARPSITHLRWEGRKERWKEGRNEGRGARKWVGRPDLPSLYLGCSPWSNEFCHLARSFARTPPSIEVDRDRSSLVTASYNASIGRRRCDLWPPCTYMYTWGSPRHDRKGFEPIICRLCLIFSLQVLI